MSATLRILLIFSSVFTVIYILRRIQKTQLRIQDSVFWIVFSGIVLILALFPHVIVKLTALLGVASPVNFVYLVFIFFAYIKLFTTTARVSSLENKLRALAYEEALRKKQEADAHRNATTDANDE